MKLCCPYKSNYLFILFFIAIIIINLIQVDSELENILEVLNIALIKIKVMRNNLYFNRKTSQI